MDADFEAGFAAGGGVVKFDLAAGEHHGLGAAARAAVETDGALVGDGEDDGAALFISAGRRREAEEIVGEKIGFGIEGHSYNSKLKMQN